MIKAESKKTLLPAINNLFTWTLFFLLLIAGWDMALGASIRRIKKDVGTVYKSGKADGKGFRRPYLMALSAFSVAIAWSWIAVCCMLVYWCTTTLVCMGPYLPHLVEKAIGALFTPDLLLHCVDAANIPFHAAVAVTTVAAASISIGFYVTEKDLEDESSVVSKAVRILFIAPIVMAFAYVAYAATCIFA